MKQDKAMELVAALRSGKFEQTRGQLKTGSNEYCCLGVACIVAGFSFTMGNQCEGHLTTLPNVVEDYFGFADDCGARRDGKALSFGLDGLIYSALTVANDGGKTFEEIADYIEQNWEAL